MHKQTLFLMALSGWSVAWPEGDPRAAKPLLMKSTFKRQQKLKSLILQNPGPETTRLNEMKTKKKQKKNREVKFTVEFLVQGEGSEIHSQKV